MGDYFCSDMFVLFLPDVKANHFYSANFSIFSTDERAIHSCSAIFHIFYTDVRAIHFRSTIFTNIYLKTHANLTPPFIFTHLSRLPLKKREPAKCCFPLYAPGGANESSNLFSRLTNLLYSLTKASWTVPTGPLRCFAMMISMIFLSSDSLS